MHTKIDNGWILNFFFFLKTKRGDHIRGGGRERRKKKGEKGKKEERTEKKEKKGKQGDNFCFPLDSKTRMDLVRLNLFNR